MTTFQARSARRSLFLPVVLIGFGFVALGQRFGWFEIDIWQIVSSFWPLLLIGLGLDLIFGRRRAWVGLVLALAVFGGIAATAAALGTTLGADSGSPQAFSNPLAGVRSAQVNFNGSASTIILKSLPAEDPRLLSGTFTAAQASLNHEFKLDDGVAKVRLESKKQGWFLGMGEREWKVDLSRQVPLELDLDFSAVSIDVDLRDLQITDLELDLSASDGTLTLPVTGNPTITIEASASSVIVIIPPGVEARITADLSASSLETDPRFTKQGNIYTTAGWADSQSRLSITLEATAASLEIR